MATILDRHRRVCGVFLGFAVGGTSFPADQACERHGDYSSGSFGAGNFSTGCSIRCLEVVSSGKGQRLTARD